MGPHWQRQWGRRPNVFRGPPRKSIDIGLIFAIVIITFMIGLRYEVGGDWETYLKYLRNAGFLSFEEVFSQSDPGYILFNWLAVQINGDIWLVNFFCGLVFACGLFVFVREQPQPWLALLVAVPYLIIVVAMGYSRQAVAIGFAMLALVALGRGEPIWRFILWVALAASFHKTAVLLIPIAGLSVRHGRIWTAVCLALAGAAIYVAFLEDSVDALWVNYVVAEYQSQGAAIRIAMNALPAVIFLLLRKKFWISKTEYTLWTNISIGAIIFVIALSISPSSTAVDRMALYWIPLQLFVLSRLPNVFSKDNQAHPMAIFGIIAYSLVIQFVWLNYASHADAWIPYKMYFVDQ